MNFSEKLNNYIEEFECTSKELSDQSQISTPVISRFRNGKKLPNVKSGQLKQLSKGLYLIASAKSLGGGITEDDIYSSLIDTIDDDVNLDIFHKNFNELIIALNINVSDLSSKINFSPSLLSKIKSGQRNPAKPKEFIDSLATYITNNFNLPTERNSVSLVLNKKLDNLSNDDYKQEVANWLAYNVSTSTTNYIDNFLNNLDSFNLEQYIKSIHFDEMKIPFIPFYKSTSKTYYGLEGMKQSELDFFKATVLSKNKEPIFMCSDMPMEDMGSDIEFGKKWMYAIALSLKKGHHINIIHDLNRPFNEMMLGLESWIPIYMTGQVSPYYFKSYQDNVYKHRNYVSGSVALFSECVKGHIKQGKCYLANSKAEVEYYKEKAKNLLKLAEPLMKIYTNENINSFNSFMLQNSKLSGTRRRVLPSLPIHTISNELLLKILKRNNISKENIKEVTESVNYIKEITETILKENKIVDEIEEISEEDFNKNPYTLFLSNTTTELNVSYTYKEYLEHFELTKTFAKNNKNYQLKTNKTHAFKNIQIFIHDKKFVMISKNTSPSIHFVIYHPKLRNAIENFIPPVLE